MSVGELERAAGISRSMAGKYRRLLMAEAAASARQLAQEQVVIAPPLG
jgi:hypothetical protein